MPTEVTLICNICHTKFKREKSIWKYKKEQGQKNVYCSITCSNAGLSKYRKSVGINSRKLAKQNLKNFNRKDFDPYRYFKENWNKNWLESRLDKKSEYPCWLWRGNYHGGYPAFRMRHKETRQYFWLRMRRVFCKNIGRQIYTICKNVECVNPEHLFPNGDKHK